MAPAEVVAEPNRGSSKQPRTDRNRLDVLDSPTCLALLATASIARVAYTAAGVARIVPLNIAVAEGALWFRVGTGGLLAAILDGQQLTLEVDEIDSRTRSGWSVVVSGLACESARRPGRSAPDACSWLRPDAARLVRLTPLEISGRRLAPSHTTAAAHRRPGS